MPTNLPGSCPSSVWSAWACSCGCSLGSDPTSAWKVHRWLLPGNRCNRSRAGAFWRSPAQTTIEKARFDGRPGPFFCTQGRHRPRHRSRMKRIFGIRSVVTGWLARVAGSLGTLQRHFHLYPAEDDPMRERRFLPYPERGICLAFGAWLLIDFHRGSERCHGEPVNDRSGRPQIKAKRAL